MCHWNKALLYDCYCEWCLTSKTAEQKKVCQGCLLVSPVEIISAWDTQWGACRAGGVTGQEVISCDSRIVELTHTIRRNSSPTNMLLNCFSGTNEVECLFVFFKKVVWMLKEPILVRTKNSKQVLSPKSSGCFSFGQPACQSVLRRNTEPQVALDASIGVWVYECLVQVKNAM